MVLTFKISNPDSVGVEYHEMKKYHEDSPIVP